MSADRFVEVSGARIRYRTEGSGPPVVLIHGIGASLDYWNWTVPALRDRYTTVALDLPGFGQSDPLESTHSPEGAAAAVLEFMDAVGLRAATLIGSSLGGAIAAVTAGVAPERITALVLAELHGRMGYFPPVIRLRPAKDALPLAMAHAGKFKKYGA